MPVTLAQDIRSRLPALETVANVSFYAVVLAAVEG